MILPVVKLGALALKTVSKPIASRLKKEAVRNPRFRELIISIAQANHRITTNIQRRLYGQSTDVSIRPLNEERAIQAATDLFGEILIFLVGGGIVIFEVQRSSRSEARKEELRKQELEVLKRDEQELAKKLDILEQRLAELQKLAAERGLPGILKFGHNARSQESSNPATAS